MDKRYRVWFTFLKNGQDSDSKWHRDFLDNDGKGFSAVRVKDYAEYLKEVENITVKDIVFEEMGSELFYKEEEV